AWAGFRLRVLAGRVRELDRGFLLLLAAGGVGVGHGQCRYQERGCHQLEVLQCLHGDTPCCHACTWPRPARVNGISSLAQDGAVRFGRSLPYPPRPSPREWPRTVIAILKLR